MKIPVSTFFLLGFFVLQSGTSTGSQRFPDNFADSLEVKLILVNEAERVEILNILSERYLRNYPQKAMDKAKEALGLSRKLDDKKSEAQALRNLGKGFQKLIANYDSALYYCFESLKISEQEIFKEETIKTCKAIGNIYSEVGNYAQSTDFLTMGQLIATELKLFEEIVEIKISRSGNLVNLDLNTEALEELRSALKICKLNDLTKQEGHVRLAFGDYYLTYSSPELSMENIKLATEIFKAHGDEADNALALFYLAQWHTNYAGCEEAIDYYRQSLLLREKAGDLYGIAECYLNIGLCQNKLSQYSAAIKTLESCADLSQKINAKRILRRCYNQFFVAYTSMENLKKAIEYRDLYVAITELIFAEENERLIAEQRAKFDIEKKDQELELQRERLALETLRLDREKKFNLVLTLLVIILLASGFFIFILYRQNRKSNQKIKEINRRVLEQNQQLKRLNDTKDKFFSIIGHDLKGPLASLSSFLNLLKNHLHTMSAQEIVTVATDLDKSTKNLHSLLENLLTWARSQTNSIKLNPEKVDLTELVKENFTLLQTQAQSKNIELRLINPGPVVCEVDKNTINTALRNLISNAIKFTFEHGYVEVKIEEWKDAAEVSVKDNGMGIGPEAIRKIFDIGTKHTTPGTKKEKGTGLGLILCKEFIEKNKGKLSVISKVGEGSIFSFVLPKQEFEQQQRQLGLLNVSKRL